MLLCAVPPSAMHTWGRKSWRIALKHAAHQQRKQNIRTFMQMGCKLSGGTAWYFGWIKASHNCCWLLAPSPRSVHLAQALTVLSLLAYQDRLFWPLHKRTIKRNLNHSLPESLSLLLSIALPRAVIGGLAFQEDPVVPIAVLPKKQRSLSCCQGDADWEEGAGR